MESSLYNIGTGKDISIKELALLIKKIVNYDGEIRWDTNKPDGTPKKLLNTSKINQKGWNFEISLEEGIKNTYSWFIENKNNLKQVKF